MYYTKQSYQSHQTPFLSNQVFVAPTNFDRLLEPSSEICLTDFFDGSIQDRCIFELPGSYSEYLFIKVRSTPKSQTDTYFLFTVPTIGTPSKNQTGCLCQILLSPSSNPSSIRRCKRLHTSLSLSVDSYYSFVSQDSPYIITAHPHSA